MCNVGRDKLEEWFPALKGTSWTVESKGTSLYNCFAWAAGESHRRWDFTKDDFWPDKNKGKYGIAYLVAAYRAVGFKKCDASDGLNPDERFDKIVLYCRGTEGTHAARLLDCGRWTSKIGDHEDIEHEQPEHLHSGVYGEPFVYMKRKRVQNEKEDKLQAQNSEESPPVASATKLRSGH